MSPSRAIRSVVEAMYPLAHVYSQKRGDAVIVELRCVPEAPAVEQIREALPAAEVVVKQDRRPAHGTRFLVLEIRPVEERGSVEEPVPGGPRELSFGSAA